MARDKSPMDICSVCGAHNYRTCPCPWAKPFSHWPPALMVTVKRMVAGGSPEAGRKA